MSASLDPHYLTATFRLDGEVVLRVANGRPVSTTPNSGDGYCRVAVGRNTAGGKVNIGLHRLKFLLIHGWLPERVDHEDRDPSNNVGSNLRAATHAQNMWNAVKRTGRALPRGVRQCANSKRFQARITGRHLGTFDTVQEASAAYERVASHERGLFHPTPEGNT